MKSLQRITSSFADASRLFVHKVSLRMTEVFISLYSKKNIDRATSSLAMWNRNQHSSSLTWAESSNARIDNEFDDRLPKAYSSFSGLYKRVWKNTNINNKIKICVYRLVAHMTLLYDSETWDTYRSHPLTLCASTSTVSALSSTFSGAFSDAVTNIEILKQLEIPSIEAMPLKYHHQWAGHISRILEQLEIPSIEAMPLRHHHQWAGHISRILEQLEIPSIEAMLLKHHHQWAGHISRILEQLEIPSIEAMPLKYHHQWVGHISRILEQLEIPSIEAMPLKYHHHWAGHISRMLDHRLPSKVLY